MNNLKLENGLIDIGGILTETYVRESFATPEAKEGLGLDKNAVYKASIGTAFIDEYLSLTVLKTRENESEYISGIPETQAVCLDSVCSTNPSQDRFRLTLESNEYGEVYTQVINKTQQFTVLPKLVVRPGERLLFQALTEGVGLRLIFKLCALLPSPTVLIGSETS